MPEETKSETQKTLRVFIAVVPQGLVDDNSFQQVFKKIRIGADRRNIEVRWTPLENLHITTNFIGSVAEDRVAEIAQIMDQVAQKEDPFTLELRQVGAFPNERQARVVWIGVAAAKPLVAMQQDLRQKLVDAGFEQEEREYRPHLTLGRIRKTRNAKDWLSPVVRKKFGDFPAQALILFESRMQGPHPVYIPLHKAPLKSVEEST